MNEALLLSRSTPDSPSTSPASNSSTSPRSLVTPRRLDLAVKWRLFRHIRHGGDDSDAVRIYCWHIKERSGARMQAGLSTDRWKKTVDDYLQSAWHLFWQIKRHGFSADYPVPIDPDGELLDGSHRVACAVALGLTEIPVERRPNYVWAPAWDWNWFVEHGMMPADLDVLKSDFAEMRR